MYIDKRFKYKNLDAKLHRDLVEWFTPGDAEIIKKHLAAEEGITPDTTVEISSSIGYQYGYITRVSIINPDGSTKIVAYYKFAESGQILRNNISEEDMEEEAPWRGII